MRRLSLTVLLVCSLLGCVAHEKIGDQAAVVGDWKEALEAYRQALINDPNSPALREKFQQAQREAVALALRRAQGCATARDWPCALAEADYALAIDAGNPQAATLRAEAARSQSRDQLQQARAFTAQGQVVEALGLVRQATALSGDAEVAREAARVQSEALTRGDAEAERLRRSKAYPQAVAMLEAMAAADATRRPKLEAVRVEFTRFQEAEAERLTKEGDGALAARRWAEARAKYAEALQMKPGGRAEPLLRYAAGMEQADAALAQRDFAAAAAGYQQAMDSGMDRDRFAATQLQRVQPRPYVIRIRSLLVRPVRPDGQPWVGRPVTRFSSLITWGAGVTLGPTGESIARRFIDAAERIPPENRPILSVIATLPDGTRLSTPARKGLYVAFDSEFVVLSNAYDERTVELRVIHSSGTGNEDVGLVRVALKDLVASGQFAAGEQSVTALQLAAEAADTRMDGAFLNMRPIFDESNVATDFSVPTPRSRPFLLQQVRATVVPTDYDDEQGTDGPPDLFVMLEQGGRVVYRSPWMQDRFDVAWTPAQVPLFVAEDEQLVVRLVDVDSTDEDLIINMYVPAAAVAAGHFEVPTPGGGSLMLEFVPRQPMGPR